MFERMDPPFDPEDSGPEGFEDLDGCAGPDESEDDGILPDLT